MAGGYVFSVRRASDWAASAQRQIHSLSEFVELASKEGPITILPPQRGQMPTILIRDDG